MPDNRCPRCFSKIDITAPLWTDDPIKTPKGEAGEDYIGFIYFDAIHIEELQEARQQQEIDADIAEEDKTTFTPVRVSGQKVYFYKKHLRELRESTEKILDATGQTKEEYFNYDDEGTEYNIGDHQLDWKDVDIDQKFLSIKAVHIEDLRHYLDIGVWIETWERAIVEDIEINGVIQVDEIIGSISSRIWSVYSGQTPSYGNLSIQKIGENKKLNVDYSATTIEADRVADTTLTVYDAEGEISPKFIVTPSTHLKFDISDYSFLGCVNWWEGYQESGIQVSVKNDGFFPGYFRLIYKVGSDLQGLGRDIRETITSNTIYIYMSDEDFLNFDRNIYNDLIRITGYEAHHIEDAPIVAVQCRTRMSSSTYEPKHIKYKIDNIKLYDYQTGI